MSATADANLGGDDRREDRRSDRLSMDQLKVAASDELAQAMSGLAHHEGKRMSLKIVKSKLTWYTTKVSVGYQCTYVTVKYTTCESV